ncbi:Protein RMD5-like protein A [Hypsibius exemplaris]|uniref:Protein RMD5-like protein A n=1 Tax=Hypsibius exemplaris TaxID=2072580 RepID=A0A1W0X1T8_HYPEX|nr:Protein RMD5-like protein A [Hypsibius exemplaris]
MDACQAVDVELDKVQAKFEVAQKSTTASVEEILAFLENVKSELQASVTAEGDGAAISSTMSLLLKQAAKNAKETATKMSVAHRDIHPIISKLGKAIDRGFTSEFNVINCPESLTGKEQKEKVAEAIVEHLFRQGLLDVAQKLAEEAKMQMDETKAQPFVELNAVLQNLAEHDVGPALKWVTCRREELEARHSSLEYKLHKMQFIELLKRQPVDHHAILAYARVFQNYRSPERAKDIQRLMGSLVFLKRGIDNSPYKDLLSAELWVDVSETFMKDACALLGLSMESPLNVCLKIGCKAIPVLLNIKSMMLQQQVGEIWNSAKTELPVEIEVAPDYLYHSRFTCPILRQQATEKNPPMRLNCGHVISKDALTRLGPSTKSPKIKCPYCPSEQNPTDAKRIFL